MFLYLEFKNLLSIMKYKLTGFLSQEASHYCSSMYCHSCLPLHACRYTESRHQFFFCNGLKRSLSFVPLVLALFQSFLMEL